MNSSLLWLSSLDLLSSSSLFLISYLDILSSSSFCVSLFVNADCFLPIVSVVLRAESWFFSNLLVVSLTKAPFPGFGDAGKEA